MARSLSGRLLVGEAHVQRMQHGSLMELRDLREVVISSEKVFAGRGKGSRYPPTGGGGGGGGEGGFMAWNIYIYRVTPQMPDPVPILFFPFLFFLGGGDTIYVYIYIYAFNLYVSIYIYIYNLLV